MDSDPFALLFSATLSLEVDTFLYILWSGARGQPSECSLTRLKLTEMQFRKKKLPPEHEFLFIRAIDLRNPDGPSGESSLTGEAKTFILERTVELNPAQSKNAAQSKDAANQVENNIVQAFIQHPDCVKVLTAVSKALTSIPTTILIAGAATAAAGASSPAVASVAIPLSLASTFVPSSSHTSSSLPSTNPITEPSHSIINHTTLTLVSFFHFLSTLSVARSASKSVKSIKPPNDAPADDRWVGGSKADTVEYEDSEDARRTFHPLNLTIFHLALLVHIIHRHYPIYSLFKRNCFWFTALIFSAAKLIDKALHKGPEYPEDPEDPEDPKGMIDLIFLPLFLYAPEAVGRWMRFKVCDVKHIVVHRIVDLFLEELESREFNVRHSF